ncbi:MAG TPA: NAD(P)-dependent oxidoreductase [Patescibacteria group bacterium]|nr:NAD(P)-dependent oxidoreductase [Patescibacteria group bacterium]
MNDSEIFILGAKGQLGTALLQRYPGSKNADIGELDITDQKSVEAFDWSSVKVILNAAAYTNVDGAESSEGRRTAWLVNAVSPGYLQQVAVKNDITLVHISTDYVFDGVKNPHSEYEAFSPLSVYGSSKAAGDIVVGLAPKHYILRTSWVIGEGKNFVRTMLELAQNGVNPSVVNDQVGRLTFTSTLVDAIHHLLSSKSQYGTYNVSNDGEPMSWSEIAREVFKYAQLSNTVSEVTTEQYYAGKTGIAARPLQSSLDLAKIKATGFTPRNWQEDLATYVKKELA